MVLDTRERRFEEEIEAVLCAGTDGLAVGERPVEPYGAHLLELEPGGYRKRLPGDYNKDLCLVGDDAINFIRATQATEWDKLKKQHKDDYKEKFLQRLSDEVRNRGTLEVLRKGIKLNGCGFQMAYFKPASGMNSDLARHYRANQFSVIRQLKYSSKNEKSLDLVLFLNGLPLFTAELKNPLTGQSWKNAVRQYSFDRDPKEPLFQLGRCLAHFAVDPDEVHFSTQLKAGGTRFFPFNKGAGYGSGNPPNPRGYATDYLWKEVWSRDSVLDLLANFVALVDEEDDKGKKTGRRLQLFPRLHQLDCVRRLLRDAQARGAGRRYLIQHSAGSGKSNTIAWLAHQLASLHDAQDRKVFDSVVVVTDRRVLDRQLRRTVQSLAQVEGVVEAVDGTSEQLKTALEQGKQIIVTTLQKFPVIQERMRELKGDRFAVLIDEAHSSQSGEASAKLKLTLTAKGLDEAEAEEGGLEPDAFDDALEKALAGRGWPANVSFFAFTATPKARTLELFGEKQADGSFVPFSLYTMRQAIEEGFILDVLQNYQTYRSYFRLLKKIEDDPRVEKHRARYLLKRFVDLSPQAIGQKVEIAVDHFARHVAHLLGGQAKAMLVTRSRLHAVRFKLALDAHLAEKGLPYKALVAFSGTVKDIEAGGTEFTEAGMNGLPEAQTAEAFKRPDYRFMVVAEKFQTGFDQPKLCAMYVDKKLGGVGAVQTLSRLNRTYPDKTETCVLDFVNAAEDVQKPFEQFHCRTSLSEATDPNLLYDLQNQAEAYHLHTPADVEAFNRVYLKHKDGDLGKVYASLEPVREKFQKADKDDQVGFKGKLKDFARLYAFVSQVATFKDPGLEQFYHFARLLWRRLEVEEARLPQEVLQAVDLGSYRLQETFKGSIKMERGKGRVDPAQPKGAKAPVPEELEPLSAIIKELNERFGMGLSEKHKVVLEQLDKGLVDDPALKAAAEVNPPDNFRLSFEQVARERLQDLADSHFEFFKKFNDDEQAAEFLLAMLAERYLEKLKKL